LQRLPGPRTPGRRGVRSRAGSDRRVADAFSSDCRRCGWPVGKRREGGQRPAGRPSPRPGPWFAGAGAIRLVLLTESEPDQLGARHHEPDTTGPEIHGQGGLRLNAQNTAEAVGVVANLVPHGELLCRRSGRRGAEGAGRQEAPGRSAGWLHHCQYAPAERFAAGAIGNRPNRAQRGTLNSSACIASGAGGVDGPARIPARLSRRWNNLTDDDVLSDSCFDVCDREGARILVMGALSSGCGSSLPVAGNQRLIRASAWISEFS
jgi:hypothetical protein